MRTPQNMYSSGFLRSHFNLTNYPSLFDVHLVNKFQINWEIVTFLENLNFTNAAFIVHQTSVKDEKNYLVLSKIFRRL